MGMTIIDITSVKEVTTADGSPRVESTSLRGTHAVNQDSFFLKKIVHHDTVYVRQF